MRVLIIHGKTQMKNVSPLSGGIANLCLHWAKGQNLVFMYLYYGADSALLETDLYH